MAEILIDTIFFLIIGYALISHAFYVLQFDGGLPEDVCGATAFVMNTVRSWVGIFLFGMVVIPILSTGGIIEFVSDSVRYDRDTITVQAFFVFATSSTVVFPVVWYSFWRWQKQMERGFHLSGDLDYVLIGLGGAVLNMFINLLAITYLWIEGGEDSTIDFDEGMWVIVIVGIMKFLILPPLQIVGLRAILKFGGAMRFMSDEFENEED